MTLEQTPLQRALGKSRLSVNKVTGSMPDDLRIEDGQLKWSIQGSSAEHPGKLQFAENLTDKQIENLRGYVRVVETSDRPYIGEPPCEP